MRESFIIEAIRAMLLLKGIAWAIFIIYAEAISDVPYSRRTVIIPFGMVALGFLFFGIGLFWQSALMTAMAFTTLFFAMVFGTADWIVSIITPGKSKYRTD